MTNIFPYLPTIFFGLLDFFGFYRLYSNKLTYRFSQRTVLPTYLLLSCIYISAQLLSTIFSGLPLKLPLYLVVFVSIFFVHKDRPFKKIFEIMLSLFLIFTCELVVLFLVIVVTPLSHAELLESPEALRICIILSRILYLCVIETIIRKNTTSLDNFRYFAKEIFLLLFIDVAYTLIVITLFFYNNTYLDTNTAITLSFNVIFLITFLVIYVFDKVSKKSKEIMATNLKLQQIEMENKLNKDMTLVVENLRSLRHDMNNHMSVLNGLLSMSAYNDAIDYLASVTEELKIANNFLFIDNKVLSVLLNSKITKATELGITFDTEIHTGNTPLSEKDLCALIGNLIENAIEATINHENPYIFLSIQKTKNELHILCENTFTVQPIFKDGMLVTTKENKNYHGIGTKNICSIVENYHGTTTFTVDEQFRAHIILPI